MTPHETLKMNLATAITDSTDICEYVKSEFGRELLVVVNRYGAQGFPGEKEAPFVWIFSEEGENEAGDVDEETFDIGIVFGVVDTGPCVRKYVKKLRTENAPGLEVYGCLDKVETVREMIFALVAQSNHGAIFRSATRLESNVADYPLEWAKLTARYAEPDTLDE